MILWYCMYILNTTCAIGKYVTLYSILCACLLPCINRVVLDGRQGSIFIINRTLPKIINFGPYPNRTFPKGLFLNSDHPQNFVPSSRRRAQKELRTKYIQPSSCRVWISPVLFRQSTATHLFSAFEPDEAEDPWT
jgi:hypothetical protein